MDFTNWYTSVTGVVAATILAVTILKRAFGNVPYINTVPTWMYAVAISGALTALTNYVWHTLPGDLWQNMMQAVMMAGTASGFYEWLQTPTKPLAASAISAGVEVEPKNTPDRVDLGTVSLPPPQTLTALALAIGLGASSLGCAKAPPNLSPAGTAAFHATLVVRALDVLQDFAIAAEVQTPKLLSTANTRKVVNFVGSSVRAIDAAPSGWKPVVVAGLTELQVNIPPAEWQRIAPYINLLKVLIAEVP